MIDSASGNPHWEAAGRGLPVVPEPPREAEPARPAEPIARWLGWAPTHWRARSPR